MIELFQHGAMQATEQLLHFTSARHRLLTNNIANLSTPHYRPTDLSPDVFEARLQRAITDRRKSHTPMNGPLNFGFQSRFEPFHFGRQPLAGRPIDENIMYHDRNNRDLDRSMQALAENTLAHQTAIELLRNQMDMLNTAIRERL